MLTIEQQRLYHQESMHHWFDVANKTRKLLVWLIVTPLWTTITIGAFIGSSFLVGPGWALLIFFAANLLCGIGLVVGQLLFAQKAHGFHSLQDAQLEQVQRRQETEPIIITIDPSQDARMSKV